MRRSSPPVRSGSILPVRPRYHTEAIVLGRTPHGEASASLALLTPEFGLVRARAQGIRASGAKLAPALQTLALADVILVRGKETWRLSGAVIGDRFASGLTASSKARAGRVARLLLRLMQGESSDHAPFYIVKAFLEALPALAEEEADAAECLAALRLLQTLGLDAGDLPGDDYDFTEETLRAVEAGKRAYVTRVNRGIEASGL